MKLNWRANILGNLESEIMQIVWQEGRLSVRQVLERLRVKRCCAYTTVMTVMARLAAKGILRRKFDGNSVYIYSPVKTREEFFALASGTAIKNLINNYGEIAVAQFVDVLANSDLRELAKWRRRLRALKKQK